MIPEPTIQQVIAATDIVEMIGRHVPLKRAGSEFSALCPFHREKTASFYVNPAKQVFKCRGCQVGGGVIKFVQLYQNLDFPTAVHQLAERAGIVVVEEGRDQGDAKGEYALRRRLLALNAQAAEWFHRQLMKGQDAQPARDYLKKRGLSSDVAGRWNLGFAPSGNNACLRWAHELGYSEEEAVRGGLAKWREPDEPRQGARDSFWNRLMFPICNEQGEVIGFSGRILDADAKAPKYVNTPETPLFIKGRVLFGLHMVNRELIDAKVAIICEGQIDLITAYEAGVRNVIAPQGTAFTEAQARLLKRKVEEVILCFDSDSAGQKAAERSLPLLLEANLGVRVATMPAGEDPDSLIRNQGAAAFAERIAQAEDFFDFQTERMAGAYNLHTARGQAQCARKMAESIVLVTDSVLRQQIINKVSGRLRMAASELTAVVATTKPVTGRHSVDLLAVPSPEVDEAAKIAFVPPPNAVMNLLKMVLQHEEVRCWVHEQAWEELLPHIDGSELLVRVLAGEFSAANAASTMAFLATFSPVEEDYLAGLLIQKPYIEPMTVAQGLWAGMGEIAITRTITELEARGQQWTGIPLDEEKRLQNEAIALRVKLNRGHYRGI